MTDTALPSHLKKKTPRQSQLENYKKERFKPQIDWEWVGCSKTEFAMIEEEAAKKRRLRAKIEAGFTQLNDLEQMITDLEGELDEEADGSETADQIEDIDESLQELWKTFVKPGDRRKGTHLTSRLGSLEERLKKLSVSVGNEEEEDEEDGEDDEDDEDSGDDDTAKFSDKKGSFDEDDDGEGLSESFSFFDN